MIYLASDHRGLVRKEEVKKILDTLKQPYLDAGNLIFDPQDDEIDFVAKAAERIVDNDRGIFFCGSGVMADIAANRYPHLRSCLAWNKKQVEAARNDDDVNVLCLGADTIDLEETKTLVQAFLKTPFSGEDRFLRRLRKLKEMRLI